MIDGQRTNPNGDQSPFLLFQLSFDNPVPATFCKASSVHLTLHIHTPLGTYSSTQYENGHLIPLIAMIVL